MSWTDFATKTATVKRSTITGGMVGAPAQVLTDVLCTPLLPADPRRVNELQIHPRADGIHLIYETYAVGTPAIRHGDVLVVDSVDYAIRGVAVWPAADFGGISSCTHLTVEKAL